MSEVLDAVREKYPAYKDVLDDELAVAIGEKYPQYLEHPDFKAEFDRGRWVGVIPGVGVEGETGARPGPEMIPPRQPPKVTHLNLDQPVRIPRIGPQKGPASQVGAGIINAAAGLVEGVINEPATALAFGAGPAATAMRTVIGAQLIPAVPAGYYEAGKALAKGDVQGAVEQGAIPALVTVAAARMAPKTSAALEEMPSAPPRAGSELSMPKGARPPMEAAPELYLNSPEQAVAQAKAMTREATAAYEPPKPPKPEVPSTPPEPYETVLEAIRNAKADTTSKVQALFPAAQLTRQAAAELRRQAFGQAKTTPPPAEPLLDRLQAALDKGDFTQIKKTAQKLAVFDEVPESVFKESEAPKPSETKPEAIPEAPKVEDVPPKPPAEPPVTPPESPKVEPPPAVAETKASESETMAPKIETPPKKISVTNKSVRDMPQQATIQGDTITITSKVGTKKVESYTIPLSEWKQTEKGPSANPNYNQFQLIQKYTGHYDEQPGGPGQAQRIRDAQAMAIKEALAKFQPAGNISIGPGARSPGEPMKPEIEQLTDAFRGIEGKKVPIGEKVKEAFGVGGRISALRDAFGGALQGLKSTGDFLMRQWRGATLDDLLRNKGEVSAAMNQRGWETRKWAAMAKKQMPSLAERKAVSSYVDAGGDMALLEAASREVPEARRQAYRDAMNLSPDAKVAAENLVSYAEGRFQQAFEAGVLEHALDDYIHRIYQKAPDLERRASAYVQSGILQANPSLARHRMFQFDFEAEKAGLAVEKDFIPRIADYEISLSKAIAAREFIRKSVNLRNPDGTPMLIQAGVGVPIEDPAGVRQATLIKPSGGGNLQDNYVERDYPALKKWKWASTDAEGKPIFVQGNLMIHKDAVQRFDALLKGSWIRSSLSVTAKALRGALTISSTVKQSMMDLSEFHPVQVTVHGMEHRVMPWNILKDIDFTNPDVEGLLRGGVTLGGEGYAGNFSEGLMGRSLVRAIPGLDKILAAHQDWVFQSFIPRLKMTMALDALERNRIRYPKMAPDQLNYLTAREANAAFGEQNYIMLERSKTFQDVARLLLLAPDFLESRARFVGQAFTKYGGEQRVALALGALTMWTAARLMNKAVDDQFHFEPENLFSVVYNGKSYGLRTLQGDVLHLLERPLQFWMNRLNPVFTRTAIEALTGRDAFGRKRTLGQQAWDAAGTAVPISLRSSRERGIHESLLQAFGVNARRFSDVDTAYQMAQKWKQANGVKERGEFIYDPEKDVLRPLKIALSQGDEAGAVGEIKKVLESKEYTRGKLNDYFNRYANMPFTGSAANDRKFFKTLSVDERKTVDAAKTHKRNIRDLYRKARDQYDAAKASPPKE